MQTVNLLVGGPEECYPENFKQILAQKRNEIWVGADIGAVRLVENHIKPALIVGDFDTATKEELKLVLDNSKKSVIDFAKDDITDTEMAILNIMANFEFERLEIYGATGARLDQFLANLFFVLKPVFKRCVSKIYIKDKNNEISFYLPGNHQVKKVATMKYLAFIPLTKVTQLEIKDAKYNLEKTDFAYPVSLSSNEFVNEIGRAHV